MIIRVSEEEAELILGAMLEIALAHGPSGLSEADRRTITAAGAIVLGREHVDLQVLAAPSPEQLAAGVGSDARMAVRMLAVMSLVDGTVDRDKNELVSRYASALGVDESYLDVLTEAAEGEIAAATACMVRKNVESFPRLDPVRLDASAVAPFLPYRDAPDPELEARYARLGELGEGTFGRAFHEHFERNSFEFPGNPNGLAEGFTTPHDSSHVLSGYSTSELGELCVSTFIGAMHPDHPMAAEVLPVIFSWHLGVKLNEIAKSRTGVFEPRRFWTAWERGAATTVDVVAEDWDFWAAVDEPLSDLRRNYGVPPVAPELLA